MRVLRFAQGSLALLPVALLEGRISLKNLLKNWFFAYFGNLAGALLMCLLVTNAGIFSEGSPTHAFSIYIAEAKSNLTFTQAFTRGFLCNWLVCLAVWNSYGANDIVGKAVAIWPLVMGFVSMVRITRTLSVSFAMVLPFVSPCLLLLSLSCVSLYSLSPLCFPLFPFSSLFPSVSLSVFLSVFLSVSLSVYPSLYCRPIVALPPCVSLTESVSLLAGL